MNQHSPGTCLTLNASYHIAPLDPPMNLLEDAQLLLGGAHGITRSLAEILSEGADADIGDVANALWGAAVLVEMGKRNTQEAQRRIMKTRGPVADHREADAIAQA